MSNNTIEETFCKAGGAGTRLHEDVGNTLCKEIGRGRRKKQNGNSCKKRPSEKTVTELTIQRDKAGNERKPSVGAETPWKRQKSDPGALVGACSRRRREKS